MIDVGDTVKCIDNDPFDPIDKVGNISCSLAELIHLKVDDSYTVEEICEGNLIKLRQPLLAAHKLVRL